MCQQMDGHEAIADKVMVSLGDLGLLRGMLDACIDKTNGAAMREPGVSEHDESLIELLQHAACKVDQMTCQAPQVRAFMFGQMVVMASLRGALHTLRLMGDPMAPEYRILSNAESYARKTEVEMAVHLFGQLSAEGFAQLEALWPGFEGPAAPGKAGG